MNGGNSAPELIAGDEPRGSALTTTESSERRPTGFRSRWLSPAFALPEGRVGRFLFELLLILVAYFSYHLVRGAVNGRVEDAFINAAGLIRLEQSLGIFWEVQLQGLILSNAFLIDFFNWVYIWGHIPIVGALAFWIYFFRRHYFARYRNAFLISGAIGLIFYVTLPVAPPRMLPEVGFVDTVTLYNNAYRVLQPPAFVNQYAALPSLHFGWNLLVGLAVFQTTRVWYAKAFGLLMPSLMFIAVILTANHYILDPLIGGTIALVALGIAGLLHRRFEGTRLHTVLV